MNGSVSEEDCCFELVLLAWNARAPPFVLLSRFFQFVGLHEASNNYPSYDLTIYNDHTTISAFLPAYHRLLPHHELQARTLQVET